LCAWQLADVLGILLLNCQEDLSSPRDVCSLLLVDSSCCVRLQHPTAVGHVVVNTETWLSDHHHRLKPSVSRSFRQWLPKHAGLVTGLILRSGLGECSAPGAHSKGQLLQQMLSQALKRCRLSASAQHLRLRECRVYDPLVLQTAEHSGALLLDELGAAGLQELHLCHSLPVAPSMSNLPVSTHMQRKPCGQAAQPAPPAPTP
jgi:hypothetical protein